MEGAASQVQQFVENCREDAEETCQQKEPLLPTTLPDYPWQMVPTDLCELAGDHYLIAVDYFSRYPEVYKLSTTWNAIISLKSIFAHHRVHKVIPVQPSYQQSKVSTK